MTRDTLTVAAVQMSPCDDPAVNLQCAIEHVRAAAADGANIVCLPELFLGHYFCQSADANEFARAEAVPGPTTKALGEIAAELNVALLVSVFERRAPGLFHNTLAVIDGARGYVGRYRKMHIPDDPGYGEKFYFTPGDLGFRTFDVQGACIGTLVCWDQWFPEAARLTALRGAKVLFYPTAIGWHPQEKDALGAAQCSAWQTVQRAHAIANGCFVVAVNRVGFERAPGEQRGIEFWGQSFVAGPDGQVLAQASATEEQRLVVTLDLNHIDEMREGWPFLRDRRIDAYCSMDRRFIDDE